LQVLSLHTDPDVQTLPVTVQPIPPMGKVKVQIFVVGLHVLGSAQTVWAVLEQLSPNGKDVLQISPFAQMPDTQLLFEPPHPLSPNGTLHDPPLH
jgi:hypothetical protein